MTVCVRDLRFSYPGTGGSWLFDSFNLEFGLSGLYALLGFSGSGKSTLMKLIGGVLAPLRGEICASAGKGIGYVPQESSLLPWLTVAENLDLGSELQGGSSSGVEWRADLAVTFALHEYLGHRPRALSGGMKQRAAVISALTSGAGILLLDEPFAGSDRVRKAAMFDAIRQFKQRESAGLVVFTTHDPGDVFALGASAIWLDSVTRQPTLISPAGGEWIASERERLLDLMIQETV
jgi:NitT/TauT family transport system ATP-binding protein